MSGDRMLLNIADGLRDMRELTAQMADNLTDYQEKLQGSAQRVDAGDHIDGEGWSTDITHAWRLALPGSTPAVVYFNQQPEYATVKAFARAAGVPVNQVQAEQRPDA